MPKSKKDFRVSISGHDSIVVVPFKNLITVSDVASQFVKIPINPNQLGTRLTAVSSGFQQFRLRAAELRLHNLSSGTNLAGVAVGYFKTLEGTLVNQNDVYQAAASRFISGSDTVPQILKIGKSEFLGGVRPWYKVTQDTGDEVEDTTQGYIIFGTLANVTTSYIVELSGLVEFRGAIDPALESRKTNGKPQKIPDLLSYTE
jgi:hypothetical protein